MWCEKKNSFQDSALVHAQDLFDLEAHAETAVASDLSTT